MIIWQSIPGAMQQAMSEPCVMTIGNFDGVHRGHRFVLGQARELATKIGVGSPLPVVAVTFDPHPLRILAPEHAPLQLSSPQARIGLLKDAGADHVYVLAFSAEMAAWSPQEFIERIIAGELRAAGVVVGENFRFGHRATGDDQLLRDAGAQMGFVVRALSLDGADLSVDGAGTPWSSTMVRTLLEDGDVLAAADVLGRPYTVDGVVIRGDQRGRDLGFPTANIAAPKWQAIPSDGVYAGWLTPGGCAPLPAAVSVGSNPTFDGVERRVESYVLDRDDLELYGETVTVSFIERVRAQRNFDGVDALVAAVWEDVADVRGILGR